MRVLIVDDDRDLVELMTMVLEDRGHEVVVAYNGAQAVVTALAEDFDIAFIDVRMPQKNGVQSLEEIRRFKPHARVVIMTGYSIEDLLDRARDQGALEVLHKPLHMPAVLRIIDRATSAVG